MPNNDLRDLSVEVAEAEDAFKRVRSKIAAIEERDLVAITSDISLSAAVALGAEPAIKTLRENVVQQLPEFPIENIDSLRDIALAAWFAHVVASPNQSQDSRLGDLVSEAIPLKRSLMLAARALADAKLFDSERVAEIQSGRGHLDMANDLVALADLFRSAWSEIRSETAVKKTLIDRAAVLGMELIGEIGAQKTPTIMPATDDASKTRARAWTLLVTTYASVRRAVGYLRWDDDDANDFAPTLYMKKKTKKKVEVDVASEDVTDTVPAAEPVPREPTNGAIGRADSASTPPVN